MSKNFFFIVNSADFFISHRLPIANKLNKDGYKVFLLSSYFNKKNLEILKLFNINIININLNRSSLFFFNDLIAFIKIYSLILKFKPKIMHLVTIKPILYAGIISRITNTNTVIALTGLNFVKYINIQLSKFYLKPIYKFFIFLLKFVLNNKNSKIIVQNNDDYNFVEKMIKYKNNKIFLIKGSGANLSEYTYTQIPNHKIPKIIFPARMLWDKGVEEFVEAAKIINNKKIIAKFYLVGSYDPDNINAVPIKYLNNLKNFQGIEWVGYSDNMYNIYKNSTLVVLPSYKEGFPKSLQEAASSGRAIITTETSGCRDVIEDGVTGYLVPVNDYKILSEKILYLINNRDILISMSKKSRIKAVNEFDDNLIINQHIQIYNMYGV